MPGGRFNDTAGVTQLNIPQKELHVYEDLSGPTFYYYVGGDWNQDKDKFMNSVKVNSKLYGGPRLYLRYTGSWGKPYIYPGRRAPLLVHDNDLGREYDPKPLEPRSFDTKDVIDEFDSWLKNNVLEPISLAPLYKGTINVPGMNEPALVPFPANIGPIFTLGDYGDEERIVAGQKNPANLDPADRYGLIGNGYRLVSWEAGYDHPTVPEKAYDGFSWCVEGEVDKKVGSLSVDIDRLKGLYSNRVLIHVAPYYANDIYS